MMMCISWVTASAVTPDDDTTSVYGKAFPTATIGGNYHTCPGTAINIPVYLTNGPTWTITFSDGYAQWTVVGVTTPTYQLTVSPPEDRAYTIVNVDNGSCSANGTGAALVSVETIPTAPQIHCANTMFCPGSTSGQIVIDNYNSEYTYQLWFAGLQVPTTIVGTSFSGQGVAGNYFVKAINATGCEASSNSVTLSEAPAVGPAGPITMVPTGGVCTGNTATFSTGAIPGSSGYIWTFPSGSNVNGSSTSSMVTIEFGTISGNVTVYGVSMYGCGSGQPSSLFVTVNPAPTVAVNASENSVCEGDMVTITASSGFAYNWGLGQTSNQITVYPNTNTTYTVTVTDANGCTNTGEATVTVTAMPDVDLDLSDNEFCQNDGSIILTGGYPQGGIYVGIGIVNGVLNPNMNPQTFEITYVYSEGECSASATDIVVINEHIIPEFGNIPGPITNETPPFSLANYTYPHNVGGGGYSGAGCTANGWLDPSLITTPARYWYTYTYTSPYGCIGMQMQYIDIMITSIADIAARELEVYPNPVRDHLIISGISKKLISLSIYNMKGNKVYENTNLGEEVYFDAASIPSGIYYIKFIATDGSSASRKFMRE